jgi:hypothetical protein
MSLDVYSHVIAVEEIEPQTLRGLIEGVGSAATPGGDAPVMHKADVQE